MPTGTRVDRCFQKLKKTKGASSAAAICQKSTSQSLASGRSTRKSDGKKIGSPHSESFTHNLSDAISQIFGEQLIPLSTAAGIKAEHLKDLNSQTPFSTLREMANDAMANLTDGKFKSKITDVGLVEDDDGRPHQLLIHFVN